MKKLKFVCKMAKRSEFVNECKGPCEAICIGIFIILIFIIGFLLLFTISYILGRYTPFHVNEYKNNTHLSTCGSSTSDEIRACSAMGMFHTFLLIFIVISFLGIHIDKDMNKYKLRYRYWSMIWISILTVLYILYSYVDVVGYYTRHFGDDYEYKCYYSPEFGKYTYGCIQKGMLHIFFALTLWPVPVMVVISLFHLYKNLRKCYKKDVELYNLEIGKIDL